jgi:hypothetical protein
MRYSIWFVLLVLVGASSCYTFKGTTISPDVTTFYIGNFRNNAPNAPAEIGQLFSDKLRDKVLMAYTETDMSIEFDGAVTGYTVSSVAPSSSDGQIGSSLNRLLININVDYINHIDEEESFTQSFSFFQDFESSSNLADVQDALIDDIFEQITEDIFNRAFSNW